MILDCRIKEGKRPLTCYDIEEAQKYVGKKCYLANDISIFSDLDKFKKCETHEGIIDELENVNTELSMPFETTYRRWVFCIPCEWVKQKSEITYEPYTLETFENEFNIGNVVMFRGKSNTDRAGSNYKCVYSGYRFIEEKDSDNTAVILGLWGFKFKELFELYEIYRNGTWEPFGRKTNEG